MAGKVPANPFDYKGAIHLGPEMIKNFFVEDHNFSRLVHSTRNIYIHGERGSGKSMTLLYHALRNNAGSLSDELNPIVGIYVPCNTSTNRIRDFQFLEDDFQKKAISEHMLTLQLAFFLFSDLEISSKHLRIFSNLDEENKFLSELGYLFATDLFEIPGGSPFEKVKLFLQRELNNSLRELRGKDSHRFYDQSLNFSSLIIPILSCLRKLPMLSGAHFSFLMDDAQDLQDVQRYILNGWVGFRDFPYFSFKIAAVKNSNWDYITADGATIVEHHDYNIIRLEQDLQTKGDDFYSMSTKIVERRLQYALGREISVDDFFPVSKSFEDDLEKCRQEAISYAKDVKGYSSTKQVADYAYKMTRAIYFKNRASSKGNLPVYSGFGTIVNLSTGVVRNLLDPCYHMYDKVCSDLSSDEKYKVSSIPPQVQFDVILNRSEDLWKKIDEGLHRHVEECSLEMGGYIKNLFHRLAEYFRGRLLYHPSEPRVVQFSISEQGKVDLERVLPRALDAAVRAKILYVRLGAAKDGGRVENYYVPNRLLWPRIGLDPVGQAGRASIKERHLLNACLSNTKIPQDFAEGRDKDAQRELFEGE